MYVMNAYIVFIFCVINTYLFKISQLSKKSYTFHTISTTCDSYMFLIVEPGIWIEGKEEVMCGDIAEFKAEVKIAENFCMPIIWQRRRGKSVEIIDITLEKYSGSTNRKLVIPSVCKEDTWEYRACISNKNNHMLYSNTIYLHVLGGMMLVSERQIILYCKFYIPISDIFFHYRNALHERIRSRDTQ